MIMTSEEFVPVISIAPLFGSDNKAKRRVADKIDKVCRGSGFFYISDHGIDMDQLYETSMEFLKTIKDDEKQRIAIAAWNPDNVKQIRNGFQPATPYKPVEMYCYLNPEFTEDHPAIVEQLPGHEVNVWPNEKDHPGFREYCETYYRNMVKVTTALLKGFSLALGLDEDELGRYFRQEDTLSSAVFIRYPEMEEYPNIIVAEDGTELGYGAHQDVDLLVVLAQSHIQNLQAETADGSFRDVPPNDRCFLVNVGTYMHYLTHGVYRAVWHRVKHRNIDRLSIPFFVNLGYHDAPTPFHPRQTGEESSSESDKLSTNKPLEYGVFLKKGLKDLIISNGQR